MCLGTGKPSDCVSLSGGLIATLELEQIHQHQAAFCIGVASICSTTVVFPFPVVDVRIASMRVAFDRAGRQAELAPAKVDDGVHLLGGTDDGINRAGLSHSAADASVFVDEW
ncbi:MAG: hypothetical protein IPJ38_03940 [Dechloromonas sp.]|uniref:Uncharacterized protein n=1 Tax=Candidatus Dechloromonas phosphorivorans TaxID=2899244 RepID=A0A935MSC4_9RHOO|nr:hypothetical protein [Candidatus Dechloromonas phosphorivorans]